MLASLERLQMVGGASVVCPRICRLAVLSFPWGGAGGGEGQVSLGRKGGNTKLLCWMKNAKNVCDKAEPEVGGEVGPRL